MAFGITNKGFKLKTFEDIIDEIENIYKARLGNPNYKLDIYTPEGIHTEVMASQITNLWEQLLELVNNTNLDTASGIWLDKIGLILKIPRKKGKFAVGTVEIKGLENTVIPQNTKLSVGGLNYFTTNEIVLNKVKDDKYYDIVNIISEEYGDVYNKQSNIKLESDIKDIEIVLKNDITSGEFGENDTDYRVRLTQKREYERTATHEVLKKSLENLETVREALILAPDTVPSTEVGTIKIFIDGESSDEVFNVIAQKKACGIITIEDEQARTMSKNVKVENVLLNIKYNLIAKITPTVRVEIKKVKGEKDERWFNPIKEKIKNYINNLQLGEALDFLELYSEIRGIYEIRDINLQVTIKDEVWDNSQGYEKVFSIIPSEKFNVFDENIEVVGRYE